MTRVAEVSGFSWGVGRPIGEKPGGRRKPSENSRPQEPDATAVPRTRKLQSLCLERKRDQKGDKEARVEFIFSSQESQLEPGSLSPYPFVPGFRPRIPWSVPGFPVCPWFPPWFPRPLFPWSPISLFRCVPYFGEWPKSRLDALFKIIAIDFFYWIQ